MNTRRSTSAFLGMLLAVAVSGRLESPAHAQTTLPPGFEETTVFSGLTYPTAVRFSRDGRVFVTEKGGRVKVFDDLSDTTPDVFADLRTNVNAYWDRGLLGLALHPDFPTTPWVYVSYTFDAAIGGTPPLWNDACSSSPTTNGCAVSARLSRLTASGNTASAEDVLIENWCQQFPSHSIGGLVFGRDGALYVGAGSGDSFTQVDYGQLGTPPNVCDDPADYGGGLRGQNLGLAGFGQVTYDGKLLRVDENGAALSTNPLHGASVPGQDRIVAYGLRQPFRTTVRPGTDEIWIGDVGWESFEEIDRIADPRATPSNFGWPCYEGPGPQPGWVAAHRGVCDALYATGTTAVAAPIFTYGRAAHVVAGDACPVGSASVSGLAFYEAGGYPPAFADGLFFADFSRRCIWAMPTGQSGDPDPARIVTFATGAAQPVDLQVGPGGDLFYVGIGQDCPTCGTVRRIRYHGPSPQITQPADGSTWKVGDVITFEGSASDPEDGALSPANLHWSLVIQHCPGGQCHPHEIQEFDGVASGAFTAPDHEYPSFLELTLTATDSTGLSAAKTIRLDPRAVDLTFESEPAGLTVTFGTHTRTTPFTERVIVGSTGAVSVESPQALPCQGAGCTPATYKFAAWSDGGARSHDVVAPAVPTTLRATFTAACGDGTLDAGEACDDGNTVDDDGCQHDCTPTCVAGAPGTCDDADPCTLDTCAAGPRCAHSPVSAPDDLRSQEATCTLQPVPASMGRKFASACALIRNAAATTPKKSKKLYGAARKRLKGVKASLSGKPAKKIDPACAKALTGLVDGAIARIAAAQSQ
ncbi:MAG: PQQ-dependent sugar dehydrogenase [Candidatus Binatia bacterium]